ncbi:MAG: RelA/SpoT family protein [Phytoplasma sp.]|uniref:RelA/SpoT family protein n=1 Tax=Phytoplasma sp. TaxID=2155 RepID=UPI002B40B629|nr:RelA/SpoT family protein [Phytoplasma sp.]WRH06790.1 MAG: RelA/SpoT family protein [Phytoplasma sp.]
MLLLENKSNKGPKTEDKIYQELTMQINSYIKNPDILNKIHKSYLLAKEKHKNQKRATGEDFIIHPIHVTKILSELKSEPNTLIAGLLHDTLEDTDLTFEELKSFAGEDVADIVKRTTKLTKIVFNQQQTQIDNQQNMFLAMANDIRVILVKFADRLHNMQTLKIMRPDKRIRISKETLSIYVPLTHRLGLFKIKSELEDLSFRYINPEEYYRISSLINMKKNEREKSIKQIINNIEKLFHSSNIKNFSISGRSKNIYSIYKKMTKRQVSFEEIFDLLAIRIIVDEVDLCYRCLGIIHSNYVPLPLRFKDYIAVPKSNLYQSLHNTVLSKDGTLFELQIRTKQMNEIAEQGIAAHWGYKENKTYSKQDKQLEIAKKLRWYQELIKITQDSESNFPRNSQHFVNAIKNEILTENVYVFTPKQEVYELPKGSTPIDFAFLIHSSIGYRMTNAIINGKIVSLDYILKNGDIINIKTNKNVFRVNKEWLQIVKTVHAKKLIKKILHKNKKEHLYLIKIGQELLEKELNNKKIDFVIDQNFLNKHFHKQDIQNINELYIAIANKKITCNLIISKINNVLEKTKVQVENKTLTNYNKLSYCEDIGIFIEGVKNVKLQLANCCSPVFNEDIIGFISKGQGIKIHRKQCPNLYKNNSDGMISAYWHNNSKSKYFTWIFLIISRDPSVFIDINKKINLLGINILKMNVINYKTSETKIRLKILINNIQEIDKLISDLSQLPNIYQIYRGIN